MKVTLGECFLIYSCNHCDTRVKTRYHHCTVCDDFDLCVNCKNELGHPHPMKEVGFELSDESSDETKQKRCFKVLTHSFQCTDAVCALPCRKMKNVFKHMKKYKNKKFGDNCSMNEICRQTLGLCYDHAKSCQETNCGVQLCSIFKSRMNLRQQQQRMQQCPSHKKRLMEE